jgi:hypothetical protein
MKTMNRTLDRSSVVVNGFTVYICKFIVILIVLVVQHSDGDQDNPKIVDEED